MNILVSGGYGQLGSEFSLLSTPELNVTCLGSREFNICEPESVAAAFQQYQPDALINTAAYTAVDKAESESDQAFAVNYEAIGHLASACEKADIPMLSVSTDYVFSGDKKTPYVESDTPNPQGVYGESKFAGEELLRKRWEKHLIVRVSWVFGQFGNNFVKTMLKLGSDRDVLGVVADQFGGPTAARCIAEGLLATAHHACSPNSGSEIDIPWGTYHLPSEPYVSWHEFACEIFDRAHKLGLLQQCPTVNAITTADYPTPAKRPANSRMATERVLETLKPCAWHKELDLVLASLKGNP